eukprot:scaffold6506_cov171-Amphora_coffeaeformis.AAC.27
MRMTVFQRVLQRTYTCSEDADKANAGGSGLRQKGRESPQFLQGWLSGKLPSNNFSLLTHTICRALFRHRLEKGTPTRCGLSSRYLSPHHYLRRQPESLGASVEMATATPPESPSVGDHFACLQND